MKQLFAPEPVKKQGKRTGKGGNTDDGTSNEQLKDSEGKSTPNKRAEG